jgi:hypothetical protein
MNIEEQKILELISNNILSEVNVSAIDTPESVFIIEKILLNCGLSPEYSPNIIEYIKLASKNNDVITDTDIRVSNEVNNFISALFEDKKDKLDKIAVRNKQSGAIQLISKKTYTSNSQLYTPLSAGWAKANVIMIRNKVSGEEYPVLLKNYDPNKHEKLGTASPPEKDTDKKELDSKPFSVQKNKKEPKKVAQDEPKGGKDTVRPMLVAPSLQSKTQTAFITPKSNKEDDDSKPEYPSNDTDVISRLTPKTKDKRLLDTNPLDSKSFKHKSYEEDDIEYYEKMSKNDLVPDDFDLKTAFKIPIDLQQNLKLPSAYIPTIEHLINTIGGEQTPLNVYSPNMPLNFNPNASISLFELLLLFSLTLNDEGFAKFKIQIEMFLSKSPNSNLSLEIWESVQRERELILKYLNKKYEKNYKIVAGSWKLEENLIDLGLDNSDIDTERVSDLFLRVDANKEEHKLEEFVVTPNKDNLLAILDKEKFSQFLNDDSDRTKDKIKLFLIKLFPLQSILKNQLSVVFPDVIYDYFSMTELFKTDSIENLKLMLTGKDNKITLTSKSENKKINILNLLNDESIKIKMDDSFKEAIKTNNKKIYKIN